MDVNNEILDAIEIMVGRAMKNSAAIYTCRVVSVNADKTCAVAANGGEYTVKYFGAEPTVNAGYPLFVPYSNMSKAFLVTGGAGGGADMSLGMTGATVGQMVSIAEIDDDGKPTAYKPIGQSYAISAPIMGVDFTWDGGDNTCQVIDEGSGNWQMRFLSSGNLKFLSNRLIDEFLVGGGGRGRASYTQSSNRYEAAAGGGGYTTTVKSVVLVAETVYPIVVGAGATSATAQAGTSSAFGASAAGGFSGGSDHYGKGGSGGAGGISTGSSGSMAEAAGGVDGANGGGSTYNGVGQGTTTRAFGEADGDLYASGGNAVTRGVGSITNPSPNTGDGGSAAAKSSPVQYSGASGIVIIRNHREEAAA